MDIKLADLIRELELPTMTKVVQSFPDDHIIDIETAIVEAINATSIGDRLLPGGEVAIGVGSRGINRLPEIVRTVVRWFKEKGSRPFLVPSMGSHGGATASGQSKTLFDLGVDEKSADCPIHSSMEVDQIGKLPDGQPVYLDRYASNATGIFVINRIKPHTAFRAKHESGLVKMLTIGLGKQRGANSCHQLGFGEMPKVMVEMAQFVMTAKPVLGGLAVVENAHDHICMVEAVPAERLFDCDSRLLNESRSRQPSLPAKDIDVLILDEMGKNISGAGLDGAITGRFATPYVTSDMRVNKLAVLDLTSESDGNATGMGNADIITRRLYNKIDFRSTYANAITTTLFKSVFMPLVLDTDLTAIRCALQTCNCGSRQPRIVRLINTLNVTQLMVSPALKEELKEQPNCSFLGPSQSLLFDSAGGLVDLGRWASPRL